VATNALSINIADQNCGHQTGSTSADCLPLQLSFFNDEAMTSHFTFHTSLFTLHFGGELN